MNCPLCENSAIQILDTVFSRSLVAAYQNLYGFRPNIGAERFLYCSCARCGLRHFSPMVPGDELLYVELQKFEWYYLSDKAEYEIAQQYLQKGSVLEVGAGKAEFASRCGDTCNYVGLEFNDRAVARAQEKGIKLLKEPIESHARSNYEKYNNVLAFQVLEHVRNPRSFIQACVEALAPGGVMLFAVPDHDGISGIAQNNILNLPPHHLTHWARRPLEFVASYFDLDLVDIRAEKLAPLHRQWARKVSWENWLRRFLHIQQSMLDVGTLSRAVGKAAALLARTAPISLTNVSGHTIVAVYQKRS